VALTGECYNEIIIKNGTYMGVMVMGRFILFSFLTFIFLIAFGNTSSLSKSGCWKEGGELVCSDDYADCMANDEEDDVACGGKAKECRYGANADVACGGLADYCLPDVFVEDVACGGLATYCDTSNDGDAA